MNILDADYVIDLASVILVGAAGGFAVDAGIPSDAQQWTAMGMLAAVLFWLMYKQSDATKGNTDAIKALAVAQSQTAQALALLTQRETDAQHVTEAKRAEIVAKLDRLSDKLQELKA